MKIFLIIFDTLRKDHTGKTHGNDWIKTPNFDAFAKDAIVFDNAYPESLPTIPARRAIHTGIRTFPFDNDPPYLRTDDMTESPGWTPIPSHQVHLSEYLNRFAFITAFISSTYHQFKPNMNFHLGFDEWHFIRGQEFDKYRARIKGDKREINQLVRQFLIKKTKENRSQVQIQKLLLNRYLANVQDRKEEKDYFPARTFRQAVETLETLKHYNNVFLLIDEFDPHEPWDPPDKYLNLYLDENYNGNKIIHPLYSETHDYLSEEELNCMRACYAGEVSQCDAWFGYFMEKLKEMELYEDSLIILTSDHGHLLGEHGAIGKIPTFLYPELVEIPFIIKPPGGVNGPKRVKKTHVYIHDVLPTILGFLNKEIPDIFEGIDLSVFVNEDDHFIEGRNYVTCGMALWTLYKDDHHALITSNDQTFQKLFDLSKDPKWEHDIARDNPDLCKALFERINKDARNHLLLSFKSRRFKNLEEWFQNTYLM
ncbi:MAG: sulfatase [Promethearchaeota archaeon]